MYKLITSLDPNLTTTKKNINEQEKSIHIVRMYLHGEDDRDLRGDDCIWIERPFVAENVGADQKRIDGPLGLGEIPGNLDHLRVETEEKTNKSEASKKRGTRLIYSNLE